MITAQERADIVDLLERVLRIEEDAERVADTLIAAGWAPQPNQPKATIRPESGPMVFPDDWQGIFIRGDNALYYAHGISQVLQRTDLNFMERIALEGLQRLLASAYQDGPTPTGAQKAQLVIDE